MPADEELEVFVPSELPADDASVFDDLNDYSDTEIIFDEFVGGDTSVDVLPDDVPDSPVDDFLFDSPDSIQNDMSEDLPPSASDDLKEDMDVSDLKEDEAPDAVLDPSPVTQYLIDIDGESIPVTVTVLDPMEPVLASVTASAASYTPQAWQVNLAENRSFGEHYLMWAERVYSGSSYYWRYYIALGRKISRSSNVYTYTDAEVYTYYNYNSSVTYDVSVSSGTVNGSTYLVYSDLYFDYVGVDPAFKGSVYIFFVLFMIMIVLLITGGKRNV